MTCGLLGLTFLNSAEIIVLRIRWKSFGNEGIVLVRFGMIWETLASAFFEEIGFFFMFNLLESDRAWLELPLSIENEDPLGRDSAEGLEQVRFCSWPCRDHDTESKSIDRMAIRHRFKNPT